MLIKRQDIVYTVQNDLRAEGLREKIHGTQLIGMKNGGIRGIAGNHDDRQILQHVLFLHVVQEAEAIHNRHLNVQQDQAVDSLFGFDHFYSLFSVLRLKNLVAILQNESQKFSIDCNIVYDQNI